MNRISDRLSELTAPTGEESILDVSYPTPRLKIAPWQAIVAALAVIISVLLWLALTSPPDSEHLPAIEAAEPVVTSEEALPEEVVVSLVGAVEHPGIITLPQGSRIADALEVSGLAADADIVSINHAQVLVDGEQIYVQKIGEAPPAGTEADGETGGGESSKINLNTASATELMQLPGVGEVTAEAIVSHRDTVGTFSAIEDLLDISGIGPAKFEKLQELVTV
ncbi:ComEA family DNA-binding protein [Corynebacterium sp. J010B-136]|uniref:ComEA family DNA-binding protein n=1 Tax=Corynebacterium sp. J010B-136 TaxID=2099401 RepID=UPI000CFA1315|nr:ComEA family DNA-binding protein [Corynebacterium sp. J010B-136]PQM75301.1 competence protein [Corynebacterium sp. J010B-136]